MKPTTTESTCGIFGKRKLGVQVALAVSCKGVILCPSIVAPATSPSAETAELGR